MRKTLFGLFLLLCAFSVTYAGDATTYIPPDIQTRSSIPVGTVATWPIDDQVPAGWMACNGQAVPAAYPVLRSMMANVPDYNDDQFLRGSDTNAGAQYADTTRAHDHVVPPHSHTVSGTAAPHSVSGTAAGQRYLDYHQEDRMGSYYRGDGGSSFISSVNSITAGHAGSHEGHGGHSHSISNNPSSKRIYGHNRMGYASSSSVSGSSSGGSITGWTNSVGMVTEETGDSETAPEHTLVKYIIKHD